MSLTILVPVFNDWDAAACLLERLDEVCAAAKLCPDVLLVDDGSWEAMPAGFGRRAARGLRRVDVLHLHTNLGHQRAICTGLVHLASIQAEGAVLVMDGDGEDDPAHVPVLYSRYGEEGERAAVFAARARRDEGLLFRLSYQAYRLAHRILVGMDVRIGNFSVVPMRTVQRLIRTTELWNHYAAAVVHSRSPRTSIPLNRSRRFSGRSRMNFTSLVVHGISSMAVFGHTVAVRLLMAAFGLAALALAGLAVVVTLRVATDLSIPGWATLAAGLLAVLLLQSMLAATVFSLSLMAGRSVQTVIPVRDCGLFIESVQRVSEDVSPGIR